MQAVLDRILDAVVDGPTNRTSLRAAVLHAQAHELATDLESKLACEVPGVEAFIAPFSSAMLAHTGPGVIGAAWWWDDENPMSSGSGRDGP